MPDHEVCKGRHIVPAEDGNGRTVDCSRGGDGHDGGIVSGERRVSGGKFVEAGVALGRMVRVYTLGGVENGMLYDPLVIHAKDVDHLLELIAHW